MGIYENDPLMRDAEWGGRVKAVIAAAAEARQHAYAPYSKFMVGSAIMAYDGRIFTGVNAETANYDGSHGEEIAIGDMLKGGARTPLLVVTVGAPEGADEPAVMPSCAKCYSHLYEYRSLTGRPFYIIVTGADGQIAVEELGAIYSKAFGPADLGIDLSKYRR